MAVDAVSISDVGEKLVSRLRDLSSLSAYATGSDADSLRDDILDLMVQFETLPLADCRSRARALQVLYGDFSDWEDNSPAGRLTQQIVTALAA